MSSLRLRLEARAPALRCHRAYEITVGQDLFGIWIAELTYGRIGAAGRTKTRSFARIEDAAFAVNASLSRRATLPRRLGVAYRLRSVTLDRTSYLEKRKSLNRLRNFGIFASLLATT
jgi:hypothetical protein